MHIEGTYARIQRLDDAVKLSLGMFLQYHAMQVKKLWKESENIKTDVEESERNRCNDETFDGLLLLTRTKTYLHFANIVLPASWTSNSKIMSSIRDAIC
jgi:hypothetical protein